MSAAPVWRPTGYRYLLKRRLEFDKVDLWGQSPVLPHPRPPVAGGAEREPQTLALAWHARSPRRRRRRVQLSDTRRLARPPASPSRSAAHQLGLLAVEASNTTSTRPAGRPGKVDERGGCSERTPRLPSRPGRRGNPPKNTKPTKLWTQKLVRLSRQERPGLPAERQVEC